jgi:putative chitinase
MDATGRVFVVDRRKDMIIAGGYNVYPAEIERCWPPIPRWPWSPPDRSPTARRRAADACHDRITGDVVSRQHAFARLCMRHINRRFFFDQVRQTLFEGRLTQPQVEGLNGFLNVWEAQHTADDDRWLAYILGTTHHETGRRFQPIEEIGRGRNRPYGRPDPETGQRYYGRGFVQLTWKANYRKMGDLLGVDLVHRPELALDFDISLQIIYVGMIRGVFTGRPLSRYLNADTDDWRGARRIVNGLDRSAEIASISRRYYAAISYTVDVPAAPAPVQEEILTSA